MTNKHTAAQKEQVGQRMYGCVSDTCTLTVAPAGREDTLTHTHSTAAQSVLLSAVGIGGVFPVLPVCPYVLKLCLDCFNEPSISPRPPELWLKTSQRARLCPAWRRAR